MARFLINSYIYQLVCGPVRIKEQTSERHMFKRDWTAPSNTNIHNTLHLNSERNWEDLCIQFQNNNHVLLLLQTTITKSRWVRFSSRFLQTSHRRFVNATWVFCCVNLISSRSWRTWEMNQITPHTLHSRDDLSIGRFRFVWDRDL